MGLFWDLIQQSQISDQRRRSEGVAAHAASLEQRVRELETDLRRTQEQLRALLLLLEQHFGQDLDHDGRIGD